MLGRKTKTVLGLALTGLVAGTALTPGALAAQAEGPGTNVWLSAVPRPSDTRISVTIPTAIGFVVVGGSAEGATNPISVENGNLLLPNVKVESDGAGGNKVTVTGESTLRMENYSTDVPAEELNNPEPKRVGLEVNVAATITSETGSEWAVTADEPGETDVKKYQVSAGVSKPLGTFSQSEVNGSLRLNKSFTLPAPPVEESGWTTAGVSLVPSRTQLLLDIKVGGTQEMYTATEDSAKVAQIVWEITPLYEITTP